MVGPTYTAPAPVFAPDRFTVSAVSNADPTKTASALVNVIPLENQERQSSPIKLGASGINANTGDCCSGTLGSVLVDQKGKHYVLSNNHVLEEWDMLLKAAVNPATWIPSDFITGRQWQILGCAAHTSVNVDPPLPGCPGAVDDQGEIIGLGGIADDGSYIPAAPANTTVAATVGMSVAKSGRTTGLTCGTVLATNGTVLIDVPTECGNTTEITVSFRGQVIMDSIARPGDSGSLIVEAGTAPDGAARAGSTVASSLRPT
jgi:hypothetical protein